MNIEYYTHCKKILHSGLEEAPKPPWKERGVSLFFLFWVLLFIGGITCLINGGY